MRSIGVRELRQNATEYLRLVKAGETVEVTERGKPVALLVPPPEGRIERMIREGLITLPEDPGDLLDIEPAQPTPGEKLPSEVLREMRESERY